MDMSLEEHRKLVEWRRQAQALVDAWQGLQAIDAEARNVVYAHSGTMLLAPAAEIEYMGSIIRSYRDAVAHLDRLNVLAALEPPERPRAVRR